MQEIINNFLTHLKEEKNSSKNTIESYTRDLAHFKRYIDKANVSLDKIEPINIIMFINELKKEDKSIATLNRTLSSVNTFIKYSYKTGYIKRMVSLSKIAIPKSSKKDKQILTKRELTKLRDIFNEDKPGTKRDKLMFEIMYSTGLKPTDIINLSVNEVNLDLGCITIPKSNGTEEIKNLNTDTVNLAKSYMLDVREQFKKDGKEGVASSGKPTDRLFLNKSGEMLSRQSVWKTLKKYADKANVDKDLSSNILYDSYLYHKADK